MTMPLAKFDPKLDLKLEREIDVPVHLVWKAWTTPAHLKEWFVPKPWTIASCELDLRPGGIFRTVMRSPEGEEYDNSGCYLDVVPNERLIFTDTLLPGYRPAPKPFFTGALLLSPLGAERHALCRLRHPWRRGDARESREDGLPRRLGHGGDADGGLHQVRCGPGLICHPGADGLMGCGRTGWAAGTASPRSHRTGRRAGRPYWR